MNCDLEWNGKFSFDVKDSLGNIFILNLRNKTCTFRSWMLRGIPCYHAIVILHFRKLEPIDYVAHCYRKEPYLKTYNYFSSPIMYTQIWPQSTNIYVVLPNVKQNCQEG